MKKILFLIVLYIPVFGFSQSAIDKQTANNVDAILDFSNPVGNVKGVVLPAVQTLPGTPANGTFLFDKNDEMVKLYENNTWVNLSDAGDASNVAAYSGTEANKQTVIGAQSTSVNGAVVLESANKALVLPKIEAPHLNVPNPYPGMMCYDTAAKALAVFDSINWNYWK